MIVSYGWEIFAVDCKYRHNSHPSSCVCPLGTCFYSSSHQKKSLFSNSWIKAFLKLALGNKLWWEWCCAWSELTPQEAFCAFSLSRNSDSWPLNTQGLAPWWMRDHEEQRWAIPVETPGMLESSGVSIKATRRWPEMCEWIPQRMVSSAEELPGWPVSWRAIDVLC